MEAEGGGGAGGEGGAIDPQVKGILSRGVLSCFQFVLSFHANRTNTEIFVKVCPFVIQYM